MNRITSSVIGTLIAVVVGLTLGSTSGHAEVYITGSVSASNSFVPLQTYQSNSASGSIAVDLGNYMRIGYTHKQESQEADGYKDVSERTGVANTYVKSYTKAHIISNSVDLTLILYDGAVLFPYLNIGVIVKNSRFVFQEGDQQPEVIQVPAAPAANLGMGLGIRLNRDFSLKITYLVSPAETYDPVQEKAKVVLDRSTSLGLTYQF